MADVWACTQCRSLNEGKNRCYKCRAPRDVGVAPTEMSIHGQAPAVKRTGRYRSSYSAVLTASVAIGSVFLVAVIARIERLWAARARELRGAAAQDASLTTTRGAR